VINIFLDRRFKRYCLHHIWSDLLRRDTPHSMPERSHLHIQRRENLKSHKNFAAFSVTLTLIAVFTRASYWYSDNNLILHIESILIISSHIESCGRVVNISASDSVCLSSNLGLEIGCTDYFVFLLRTSLRQNITQCIYWYIATQLPLPASRQEQHDSPPSASSNCR
jgi:hypothetical protein